MEPSSSCSRPLTSSAHPPGSDPAGPPRGFDGNLLFLVALPGLMLVWSRNWIFTPLTHWDDWFPFGYWLNLELYKASWIPDSYRGSRMPWILTGWSVHSVFDVVAANYVLHILVYLTAVLCCYLLLREWTGWRNALLFSAMLGGHPQFLYAVGHDYPDGFGIALNFAGLLLAERAARGFYPRIFLALAGAASISLFYTNLFLLAFAPFILLFYWSLRFEGWNVESLKRIWPGTLWFLTGAAGCTAALAAINYFIDGSLLFYSPTFRFASAKFDQYDSNTAVGMSWFHRAFWLALPAAVLAIAAAKTACSAFRRTLSLRDPRVFLAAHFLLTSLAVVWWEMRRGWALELVYYCSYFLVASFLLLGVYASGPLEGWKPAYFRSMVLAVALACSYAQGTTGVKTWLSQSQYKLLQDHSFWVLGGITLLALLVRLAAPARASSMIACAALLTASFFANTSVAFIDPPRPDNEHRLRRIGDAVRVLTTSGDGERPILWFDEKEARGLEFMAIDSTLTRYYVSRSFPNIVKDPWTEALVPLMRVAVLSSLPPEEIVRLSTATLRGQQLSATPIGTHRIERDGRGFHIVFFRVDRVDERPALRFAIAGGKPREIRIAEGGAVPSGGSGACWLEDSPKGEVEQAQGSVRVRTGAGDYGYSARCGPLVAPMDGTYRFTLRYRSVKNSVYFGILTADAQKWLAKTPSPIHDGVSRLQIATLPLKAGDQVLLMVANSGRPFSEALLDGLEIEARLDRQD